MPAERSENRPARSSRENPILNDPWSEPRRHWRLDRNFRATDELVEGRRRSGDYLPVPLPGSHPKLPLTAAELPPHALVNRIRAAVDDWRARGRPGVSRRTADLLDHWDSREAEPRPFFCQREAVETLIWLREAGPALRSAEHAGIVERLREVNAAGNEGMDRVAVKMATGAGKTLAMAMVIAWRGLRERRGADVLVVAPNLTVRERLAELDPSAPAGRRAYEALLPKHLRSRFSARVSILNFHKFQPANRLFVAGAGDAATGAAKGLLRRGGRASEEQWKETPEQMLARLLKAHRAARKILVLNDEGHHCYRPASTARGTSEEREYEESAALWFRALRALREQGRLSWIADFSATPMYLRLPPGLETPIFPWIVSDYPLIEAVEAGLTKVPRVPVDDDTEAASPIYRNLYENARSKRLGADDLDDAVRSPLETLYEHYEKTNEKYAQSGRIPVMIVVANDVRNATEFYRWIAGEKAEEGAEPPYRPGRLPLFSNVRPDGSGQEDTPPTILIHSKLDSPEELSGNLAAVMKKQGELFAPDAKTGKERLERLREIVQTVGKDGPGKRIRCVISVSMLSEGWDTRTVTHILGFRKFGSELLCEQVVGRSLRRTAYDDFADEERRLLRPEVSNIFGVPFAFMRAAGETPEPAREPYAVFSVAGREDYRLEFPNLAGYRWELPGPRLRLDESRVRRFIPHSLERTDDSSWGDYTPSLPRETMTIGVAGEEQVHYDVRREKEERWRLAKAVLDRFEVMARKNGDGAVVFRRRLLFRDALHAVERWLAHPVVEYPDIRTVTRDGRLEDAASEIATACPSSDGAPPRILPVYADESDTTAERVLHTGSVCYETAKRRVRDTERSEVNRAPCDSDPELTVAAALDRSESVSWWVRSDRLDWGIPYLEPGTGAHRRYLPDFFARLSEPGPGDRPIHLIIEYKGRPGRDSEAKRKAVERRWIPAVANTDDENCRGTWRYCILTRPDEVGRDLEHAIRRARSPRGGRQGAASP